MYLGIVGLALLILIGGLILSRFGRFGGQQLGGGHKLWRASESGLYYVLRGWRDRSPGGVFEGTIQRIGVTNESVFCYVRRLMRDNNDGWYLLDVKTGSVSGPADSAGASIVFGIATNLCVPPDQFRN